MLVFDGHNDTLLKLFHPDRATGRSFFERSEEGHLDLPRAVEGGLFGGLFAIFAPNPEFTYGPTGNVPLIRTADGYEVPLEGPYPFERADAFTRGIAEQMFALEAGSAGRVVVARDAATLEACRADGRFAVVLHFEGAEAIAPDLSNLEGWVRRGLRSLGLVWSRKNAFAEGVPFRFPSSPDTGPGLTPAGRELVAACNRLGVMIDLAHLNERGFWDVASLSRAPLVSTHTAVHALAPRSRNLTDAQIDAIGASGGVMGVIFANYDLDPEGRLDADVPLELLVRHMAYVAERIGVEHVAFGSDFDGTQLPSAIRDASGLPKIVGALRAHGFGESDLAKIAHGNWMRVLGQTWAPLTH
ncbi:MAG: dipeptidase [Fimbriimonadaceae bacterium]|nr:dipeptidase [Fimbriimonadaceae bacterium]